MITRSLSVRMFPSVVFWHFETGPGLDAASYTFDGHIWDMLEVSDSDRYQNSQGGLTCQFAERETAC